MVVQGDLSGTSALFLVPGAAPVAVTVSANVPLATGSLTPWLPAAVPVAMRHGSALHLDGPVDTTALEGARQAQRLLADWFPDLTRGAISADARPDAAHAPGRGVGCFFSGGVDSFFSAVSNAATVTHLIFVHGFDIAVEDEALAHTALAAARTAAADLGMSLIEVRTDIRRLGAGLRWGAQYHGAAMASVALALGTTVHTVLVPASLQVGNLHPWGSHPELDPLWSSRTVTVLHDGLPVTRLDKITALAGKRAFLDNLRVCWENPDGAYNCGRCEKCLRTMVSLRVVGALDDCRTLPHHIPADDVARLSLGQGGLIFAQQNLAALSAAGHRDPDLEAALRRAVRGARLRAAARRLRRVLRH